MLTARVTSAVRPSIEAMLLAAVALGCAQAGWTLLTPGTAGASTAGADDSVDTRHDTVEVQSPFAPDAGQMGGSSHAVAAMLSGMQLNGVRMSTDPARDGAVLTMGDGAQRAFMVGQEVADGVTLYDVEADYVLLAYAGGQQRLQMAAGPSFSFARAMMGLSPAVGAPSLTEPNAAEQAVAQLSGADRAWFVAALANPYVENDRARGWRIAPDAPQAVRAAGLQSGDIVTAINGAGPGDAATVLAAAQSGRVELQVERASERFTLTIDIDARA